MLRHLLWAAVAGCLDPKGLPLARTPALRAAPCRLGSRHQLFCGAGAFSGPARSLVSRWEIDTRS